MSRPNGGLITETNRQYYAGAQQFYIDTTGANKTFTSTFNINLTWGSSDPTNGAYNENNFKIYTSSDGNVWAELTPAATDFDATANGLSAAGQKLVDIQANANILGGSIFSLVNKITGFIYGTITAINGANTQLTLDTDLPAGGIVNATALSVRRISPWTMSSANVITVTESLTAGTYLKIQMNESAMQQNNGGYEYTTLYDVIDNFLIAYVGAGKLIPSVKRTDVIFHAKRGLQEFSYDTLKSIHSQELTIPNSLAVIIPQDYVNYVRLSWIDDLGVQRTIFPANTLTSNPYTMPAQDSDGVPTQDSINENVEGTSQIEEKWDSNNPRYISGGYLDTEQAIEAGSNIYQWDFFNMPFYGQRYGLNPETSQTNGWFTVNERTGMFNFTSNLKGKLILLEYISDGNSYELDMRIPKMAEDALYAHILHAILSTSAGIQEYVVRRFKQERSAKLRNAKIRLSNIKLDQIVQVMRQQSKWIKY